MSFRRELLERIGGFDERFGYPSIYEETDVSLKVRRLGYNICFLPDAEVVHLSAPVGGQRCSFDQSRFRFVAYRDRVLLFRNNYPRWRFPLFWITNLMAALMPLARLDVSGARLALIGLAEGTRLYGRSNAD